MKSIFSEKFWFFTPINTPQVSYISGKLQISGEVYRGKLIEAEDNMNCQMADVCVTYRDGRTHQLENVFVRGSKIRFLVLPDMLKNAPMFKNIGRAQKV